MATEMKSELHPTIDRAVDDINRQGFAIVNGLLTAEDLAEARAALDDLVARGECQEFSTCFGYGIHPLIARQPALARWCAHSTVLAICGAWLGGDPVVVHTGARVSDPRHAAAGTNIGWHVHPFEREPPLPVGDPRRGDGGHRLLFGWYLDGSSAESGALLALPRYVTDPLAPPVETHQIVWPGEIAVEAPAGALIIFTIELWHSASSGSGGFRRRLMGGHVMRRSDRRPHVEDHDHADPRLDVLPSELLRCFRR